MRPTSLLHGSRTVGTSTFSRKITAEIIDLIEESWAGENQPTPYEVYLKVCHALSEDAREGMGYVLPPSMQNLLLDYQETAVRTLARRIVRRGGTMLGDVVGLGKTLTAIATALMLEAAEDYTTLVLCPKNLKQMWEEHLERYGLVGARVIPYSMADKKLPELKRFHLVICDESHNLRNNTTKASEAIQDYVRRNGSKVLLLTATPYNLAFADVANQIGLYIDDDEDLGIQPTAAMAKDPTLIDKVDGKITTLAAFRRSEEPEDWKRLMSDHLVRRTRSFIKRTAKKETVTLPNGKTEEREYLQFADGQRFHFPTRVPSRLSHDFADDDPARLMEDEDTLDAIRDLSLAALSPRRLRRPQGTALGQGRQDPGRHPIGPRQRQRLRPDRPLQASVVLRPLLHPQPPATARPQRALHLRDREGLDVPLGVFSDHQFMVSDDDLEEDEDIHGSLESRYRELQRRLPSSTKWLSTQVFKSTPEEGPAARQPDHHRAARHASAPGTRARTPRSMRWSTFSATSPQGDKVLVFTEYADTAEYVAQALRDAGIDQRRPRFRRLRRSRGRRAPILPGEQPAARRGGVTPPSTIRSMSSLPPTCCRRVRTCRTLTSSSTTTFPGRSSGSSSARAGSTGWARSRTLSTSI